MFRNILLLLLAALAAIQFFHPKKNTAGKITADDITLHFTIPDSVKTILQKSCYDCHSNNTIYPWYNNFQPVAWWLASHVNDGKRELNFSEFGGYPAKKQYHKLKSTVEQVKRGDMPLNYYLWIHRDAVLSEGQKRILSSWADSLGKQIKSANNIPDEPQERRGPAGAHD